MKSKSPYLIRSILSCLMDCLFLNIAQLASGLIFTYFLKNDSAILLIYYQAIPVSTFVCFLIFIRLGIHKNLWSFISFGDLIRLTIAVFLASFSSYVALRLINGYWQNPIFGVTTFYLFLSMSVGVRLLPTLLRFARRHTGQAARNSGGIPVLVVGAGEAADALIKDLETAALPSPYHIVGIVDDDIKKLGHALRGMRILGLLKDMPAIIKKYNIQEIIIAIPSATTEQRRELIATTLATGCKVRYMSRVAELNEPTMADLHDIDISDLLGRPEVYLNPDSMATYITGHTILITGGGGSIGSELCRQIMRFDPAELIIFDHYENNASDIAQELRIVFRDKIGKVHVRIGSVQDRARLDAVFSEFQPQVVFHAAAYKHVPLMEECPALAVHNNVFGTYNVAQVALAHHARRFIMISTDKAVNPTNVMGASKRIAELIIQSMNGQETEFAAVRFGNVLGSNGSVVPIFRRQIETGGPVTITHPDIIRYFMTIPEAARLVLQAGAMARGGETFVLDMGEPVKILDLAKTMIEMAGLIPGKDIEIIYTGLRPGEKLYEELLLSAEGAIKTTNNKIYLARSTIITAKERRDMLNKLHRALKGADIKACMMEILPSYRPEAPAVIEDLEQ